MTGYATRSRQLTMTRGAAPAPDRSNRGHVTSFVRLFSREQERRRTTLPRRRPPKHNARGNPMGHTTLVQTARRCRSSFVRRESLRDAGGRHEPSPGSDPFRNKAADSPRGPPSRAGSRDRDVKNNQQKTRKLSVTAAKPRPSVTG